MGYGISNHNHSFGRLTASNECVINILTIDIAGKVVGCGNTLGGGTSTSPKPLASLPSLLHQHQQRNCMGLLCP
ncbi:MAG: hypothetical protein PHZ02_08170 [Desulfocapsaceae bacterium]|nr:hypothetical protein [Desulfocapsaceae bacterium]